MRTGRRLRGPAELTGRAHAATAGTACAGLAPRVKAARRTCAARNAGHPAREPRFGALPDSA